MNKLPSELIGHVNNFSASNWKIEVTADFDDEYDSDDNGYDSDRDYYIFSRDSAVADDDDEYPYLVQVNLKLPNAMRLFYGNDPLDYITDFRELGEGIYVYFPEQLEIVEENPYEIVFEEATFELMTKGPTGDIDGNLLYAIDFEYVLNIPENGSWTDAEYHDILNRLKFHTASLMEDFCRRYLQHRFKFKTDLWLSAAMWRQFFDVEGQIAALIPVINTTEVRLGKSVGGPVLNVKKLLKF